MCTSKHCLISEKQMTPYKCRGYRTTGYGLRLVNRQAAAEFLSDFMGIGRRVGDQLQH